VAVTGRGAADRRGTTAAPAAARTRSEDDEPSPPFLAAAYTLLFVLGVLLALLGVFLLPSGPRVGTTLVLPIGLAIAVIGHPLSGVLGLLMTGTRAGTLTALAGWAVVVLPLSIGTAQGDIALPATLLSIVYLLVGAATFGVVAFLTHPTRGHVAASRW
jgi:hypothetical protein